MANLRNLVALVALLVVAGCGGNRGESRGESRAEYKYDSQGAPYELVVVADRPQWDGAVGDTLRAMFYDQYPMINRQETMFDLLRVLPSGFKKLIARHQNVLVLDVGDRYAEPSIELLSDIYARPQTIIKATAPDDASLLGLIDTNRDEIMLLLENAQRQRDVATAEAHTPAEIKQLIESKFGFEMSMGPGYTVRDDKENFLWLSYEMPTASQGIIIYTYPFAVQADFEKESLIARRSEFVSLIPGENPGSHMSTNPDFVSLVYKRILGRKWSEMHGFWDVSGDFMGGPYTNYSTLDVDSNRVVAIDFYVYSPDPRYSQRNYIKQLEHYIYTVKFPARGESGE